MKGRLPVVGFPCDRRIIGGKHPFHMVGEKYIDAVRDGSNALPLLVPVLEPPLAPEDILAAVDGLLFTGSPSNVAPRLYGGPAPREGVMQDEHRDRTAIPLLRAAIAMGKPTLCICRGFQELNVALGGTLYQHIQEVPGRCDHREDPDVPLDVQYGPAHEVTVEAGGLLAQIVRERTFMVNSLHSQGIDRLAPSLRAEAVAPDGQIEAVSMPAANGFLFGVQWHPEWKWAENPISGSIYGAFGDALRGG
ncbi:MAG: gamma-glutamyl-gamma-aminobutyrate hydrolase family protein [Alphaproteobacteria bacterium]|nr:gamma-glutamyl-gamma-aminobutyrate hydrolase family protein [Alphaproteobacteria bacterium]MBL7097668.1 gamma-glutamyl-gamma-aminobutyrate hydrolase family protein [Alphaproteobacteria bacterium]